MAQFPQSFGTAFATAGFSQDPNLSPNNQGFSNAVLAVCQRAGLPFGFEPANTVLAGPASGTNALPTYRALVAADVPASILPGGFNGFGNPTNKVSGTATNGTSTTAMRSDGAPALDWAQSPTWTGNHIFNPATGTPLIVQLAGVTGFQVVGTGSLAGGGVSAGALVDMSPDSGSFVGTGTGFSGSAPTMTITWRKMGNIVEVDFGGMTGTSNATSFTINNIPAAIRPTTAQNSPVVPAQNNTVGISAVVGINNSAVWTMNTFTVGGAGSGLSSAGWTGAGTKGVAAVSFCYRIN